MARKTVELKYAVESANHFLRESEDSLQGQRKGVASFLETLLFAADVYAGYSYLPSAELMREEGALVDIGDDSRRVYYLHRKLREG